MDKLMKINMPPDVESIITKLEQQGFECFIVGGCVRDSIIGKQPQDWDITTNAKPEEVKKVFAKTIDTGLKHGTVTVILNKTAYEITTYRIEGKYINNRKPEKVDFTNSLEADLSRRDFTINAMAYNHQRGIVDPYDGFGDISKRQIRAVGTAADRFEEDALRMLRAIRFSAQLAYAIEEKTLEAMKQKCSLILNISGERIREELNKTLKANPMAFVTLHQTGLLKLIMPELDCCFAVHQNNPYHIYNVAMHSIQAASQVEDALLRWTMLLHDLGKADTISADSEGINHFYDHQRVSAEKAVNIMQRLRFDNSSINKIQQLILHHDRDVAPSHKSVRKAIAQMGRDIFVDWLKVREADMKAQNPIMSTTGLEKLGIVKEIFEEVIEEKQCLSLKDLAISGKDLMAIGIPADKEMGILLKALLEEVLEQPELNTREKLIELVKRKKE